MTTDTFTRSDIEAWIESHDLDPKDWIDKQPIELGFGAADGEWRVIAKVTFCVRTDTKDEILFDGVLGDFPFEHRWLPLDLKRAS